MDYFRRLLWTSYVHRLVSSCLSTKIHVAYVDFQFYLSDISDSEADASGHMFI